MKKNNITIDNISQFLEGNFKWMKSKVIDVPEHIKEQLQYRLNKCSDCLEKGGCIKCGCPVIKKHFVKKSCNTERFPDLMEAEAWEEFKKTLNEENLYNKED